MARRRRACHGRLCSRIGAMDIAAQHFRGRAYAVQQNASRQSSRAERAILRTLSACHVMIRRCRDIGAQTSKAGYSFSRLCLLTGRAGFLSNISNACGRFIVRSRRAGHSKRTPSASCRTISCDLATAVRRCRFCKPIREADSVRKIARTPCQVGAPRRAIVSTLRS